MISYLKYVVILAAIGLIGWYLKDQADMRETLIQTNADKVSAQAAAQEYRNANAIMKDAVLKQDQMLRQARKSIGEQQKAFTEIQKQTKAATQIFDKHNLTLLAKKKGGLIQRRANRATTRIFAEFELVLNGL